MGELSNDEIQRLLTNRITGSPLRGFSGVYMSDELGKLTPKQGQSWIVNLDRTDHPDEKTGELGTHWVLVFNGLANSVIYYDSFGMPPNEATLAFMRRMKNPRTGRRKRILYNTLQVQGVDSEFCGHFCVWALKQLLKGRPFLDIVLAPDPFNQYLNDTLVDQIQNRHVSYYQDPKQ